MKESEGAMIARQAKDLIKMEDRKQKKEVAFRDCGPGEARLEVSLAIKLSDGCGDPVGSIDR